MPTSAPSPEFVRAFLNRADDDGVVRFDAFVDLALYDPTVGYYQREKRRVGYGAGSDFFTAATSGPVFGELICAACQQLLPDSVGDYCFVEIGAETEHGVLTGVTHPFSEAKVIRLGDPLQLAGKSIVFSNELFDAQPFRRLRYLDGGWRELGVRLEGDTLTEVVLPLSSIPAFVELPARMPEGYTVDAPIAAAKLAEIIARESWSGLFIAFDYGKYWGELASATPAGTARGYFRHTQTNRLLDQPGEQDLTCHVCWDWLIGALLRHGFSNPQIETQESFLIHHGEAYLARSIAEDAGRLTRRKQSLFQLLHGAHLGHKFQVLHGLRRDAAH